MIVDELGASDSKAIQMANFTLKCKKAKEWYKAYITDKVDSITWSQIMVKFTNWAFLESSKEMKVVEFEQLRQTASMSVDKYISKFVNLL